MTTEVIISLALAYIVLGIAQASNDLDSRRNPLYTVQWALRPSLGMAIAIAALWPNRHFLRQWHRGQGLIRSIASGLIITALSMASLSAFFWGCIWAAEHLFDNAALVVASAAGFMIVGSFIALPIEMMLSLAVGALLFSVLDVILPRRKPPFTP
jgi:hypothetical protein